MGYYDKLNLKNELTHSLKGFNVLVMNVSDDVFNIEYSFNANTLDGLDEIVNILNIIDDVFNKYKDKFEFIDIDLSNTSYGFTANPI